ncbi:M24 family metallopeptidase [Streptomyces sp. NPDC014991]|uniref:M24 family metallopeptidase n=1 Tax=Streptomyces sp. NPDC014991 TaxID=3364935 RepID=UPI0036F651E1
MIRASTNDTIVHGIPTGCRLSVDRGAEPAGWAGDSAAGVVVGHARPADLRLIDTSGRAPAAGIEAAVPGRRVDGIAHAVGRVRRTAGYGIPRGFAATAWAAASTRSPRRHGARWLGPLVRIMPGSRVLPDPNERPQRERREPPRRGDRAGPRARATAPTRPTPGTRWPPRRTPPDPTARKPARRGARNRAGHHGHPVPPDTSTHPTPRSHPTEAHPKGHEEPRGRQDHRAPAGAQQPVPRHAPRPRTPWRTCPPPGFVSSWA